MWPKRWYAGRMQDDERGVATSRELIDGKYEVVQPPPVFRASFWRDDVPAVATIVLGGLGVALLVWVVQRLFS